MKIDIPLIGPDGSGKSSFAACMYKAIASEMPGYFRLQDAEDFKETDRIYSGLEETASGNRTHFTVSFAESEQWNYQMLMNGGITFSFQENPDNTEGARIFVAVIDAPLMMNGQAEDAGVSEAAEIFTESLEASKGNRVLLVVPVKCERYTRADYPSLLAETASQFRSTVELCRTKCRGRAGIAVIPVHTMGGAAFDDFIIEDGAITGEKFRRDRNIRFKPECSEQVLKFAVSFLLHEGVFKGEAKTTALKVAGGAGLDDERFSVLCGRELFDPSPAKKRVSLWKAAAVIAGLLVVAGAGYYFMRRDAQAVIAENTRQTEEAVSRAEAGISEAQEAEHAALRERDEALADAQSQKSNREQAESRAERAEKLAELYKQQTEALQKELDRVKGELDRMRNRNLWQRIRNK
ncbi:MAG: hypothetical protein IJT02_04860 [Synergistaceae bacterium]|nr:hypothetical protein [Synergistaceae bacterium]